MSSKGFPIRRLAAFAGLLVATGCSQTDSLSLEPLAPPISAAIGATSFIPSPAELIVPSTRSSDAIGGFVNTYLANNSGRTATEFWDNYSADMLDPAQFRTFNSCNIGFYAAGVADSTKCQNTLVKPGTEFLSGKYWGDSTGARDASAFMFKGGYTYTFRYVAKMALRQSEIGYFTKNTDGTYNFFSFQGILGGGAGDTLKAGITSIEISPASDWGIYIRNNFPTPTEGGGCGTYGANDFAHCSDAEGGWRGAATGRKDYQHMALFVNDAGTKYLLGIEDRKISTLYCPDNECGITDVAQTIDDADYNDHIFIIEPAEVETAVGRFTGGGIWTDVPTYGKVTMGFTLHCDNVLANNLQVSWGKGSKWHIVKNSLDPVSCTRPGNPVPPRAPVNQIVATANGRYFNESTKRWIEDVSADFILVDNGEPSAKSKNSGGTEKDRIALRIYKGGTTYLVVGAPGIAGAGAPSLVDIKGGNIQAHYDQPHGDNWNRTP